MKKKITYELIGKVDEFKKWKQYVDMNEKPTISTR